MRQGERETKLGPYDAVRLAHLQGYHVVTATCLLCQHEKRLRVWHFRGLVRPDAHLTDIDKRLRCRRCGVRGQARLIVAVLDRKGRSLRKSLQSPTASGAADTRYVLCRSSQGLYRSSHRL